MATFTQNYNLKKPDQQDFYNVEDFNNNADIIDEQLKEMANGLGSAAQESTVSSINTKIGETGNTGGTSSSGSLFAKLNKTITDVSSLNTLIGQANNTGGSATAGSVFAKLNKLISDVTTHMGRWTATRAGYIDTINTNAASAKTAATNAQNYTVTNNTASKTGILSQKESYTHSLLENTTYGLSALNSKLINGVSVVKSVQRGIVNTSNNPAEVTITPVDRTKSILLVDHGTTITYNLLYCDRDSGNSYSSSYYAPSGIFIDNSTLQFSITYIHSSTKLTNCVWQVIEFY